MKRGPKSGTVARVLATTTAYKSWLNSPPAWVVNLATAVDLKGGLRPLAKEMNVSHGTISAVINNTYKGHINNVEIAFKAYQKTQVRTCLIVGEIKSDNCEVIKSKSLVNSAYAFSRRVCKNCKYGDTNEI